MIVSPLLPSVFPPRLSRGLHGSITSAVPLKVVEYVGEFPYRLWEMAVRLNVSTQVSHRIVS